MPIAGHTAPGKHPVVKPTHPLAADHGPLHCLGLRGQRGLQRLGLAGMKGLQGQGHNHLRAGRRRMGAGRGESILAQQHGQPGCANAELARRGHHGLAMAQQGGIALQMLLAAVGNLRPIAHHADGMHQYAVLHCGVGQHQRHIGPGGAGADELVQGGLHRCQKAGAQHIVARHGAATQGQGRGHQAGHAIALGLLGRRG